MSFLDEEVVTTDDPNKAEQLAKRGVKVNLVDKVSEKKGRDMDGDGDIDSDDYLAARDAAIKKAKAKKAKAKNEEVEEGKLSRALGGIAVLATLLGINKAASERIYNSDPQIKAATEKYEKAKKDGDKEAMAEFEKEIKDRKLAWDAGKPLDEAKNCGCGKTPCKTYGKMNEAKKTVELPADTTFTLDLKHLMKKHMDEGKSQENVVKLTKKLMAKLHDKGEVKVDGTKVIFKEGKKKKSGYMGYTELAEDDTQLALPEPDAPDYLGDDGMDYEGGMAKSQMLKMKKYAMALCDMVEDETQLEAWVQSKITKASDYMSSVYHYLDYQRSKMDEGKFDDPGHEKMNRDRAAQLVDKEEEEFKPLTQQEKDSLVKNSKLKKSELAAYEKFLKDNPDLPDSLSAALKAFKNRK